MSMLLCRFMLTLCSHNNIFIRQSAHRLILLYVSRQIRYVVRTRTSQTKKVLLSCVLYLNQIRIISNENKCLSWMEFKQRPSRKHISIMVGGRRRSHRII